uniref:Uncharacterized protein n=1 Tax=Oryzias latipes TaxID=8090 RepID=A0A3P9K2C2_ORYLA
MGSVFHSMWSVSGDDLWQHVGDAQEGAERWFKHFTNYCFEFCSINCRRSTSTVSVCIPAAVSSAVFSRKRLKRSHLSETMSSGDGVQATQQEPGCGDKLLHLKIRAQLEEMFTDAHLAEDGFLLKHLQSRHGFVSLKLLTCLKKIKTLTTNWHETLEAALSSDLLEVNAECTKLRRKQPLPNWLLSSPTSKLLLVWNPCEEQSRKGPEHHALLLMLLQNLGLTDGIASLWILRPGEQLPKELQCYTKRHQELGRHGCTVVKFDHLEEVRRAYTALRAEEDKCNGEGFRVVALGCKSMCKFTKHPPGEEKSPRRDEDRSPETTPPEMSLSPPEPSIPAELSEVQTEPDLPSGPAGNAELGAFLPDGGVCSCCQKYLPTNMCFGDSNKCPWVLRRKSAARHTAAALQMKRVLRQPFGPDGGRGFHPRGRRDQTTVLPSWD